MKLLQTDPRELSDERTTMADFVADYPALLDCARSTVDEVYRRLYEIPVTPETPVISDPEDPD